MPNQLHGFMNNQQLLMHLVVHDIIKVIGWSWVLKRRNYGVVRHVERRPYHCVTLNVLETEHPLKYSLTLTDICRDFLFFQLWKRSLRV